VVTNDQIIVEVTHASPLEKTPVSVSLSARQGA